MRPVHYVIAALLGAVLALVTLLSLMALGPRWDQNPAPVRFLVAAAISVFYWALLVLLRRYTALLPRFARYVMFTAVCLTWFVLYVSVKAHDDPPIFALMGPLICLPALFIYNLGRPA